MADPVPIVFVSFPFKKTADRHWKAPVAAFVSEHYSPIEADKCEQDSLVLDELRSRVGLIRNDPFVF